MRATEQQNTLLKEERLGNPRGNNPDLIPDTGPIDECMEAKDQDGPPTDWMFKRRYECFLTLVSLMFQCLGLFVCQAQTNKQNVPPLPCHHQFTEISSNQVDKASS